MWRRLLARRPAAKSPRLSAASRRLRFEPLEDRRLLAIIADTFADTFAQVTRITGQEVTVLTADAAGNTKIFYHANDDLGYIDPATGDLLLGDYFTGTAEFSTVLVLDATPNGNLSDLTGIQYSNGQVITPDGGLTVYHRDGSIMRSGSVWTYDAGATLTNGTNWFWSTGNQLLTGANAFHPTGATLRSGTSLFYVGGVAFQSGTSLNYATGQALQDGGDYFYEDGAELRTGDIIYHPTGGVMVDDDGAVYNENGNLSFAPYTRTNTIGASEVRTDVSFVDSHTTLAIANHVGGAFGAYVTRFDITYQELPPDPVDLKVTYIDDTTLLFQWASGGGSTARYRVAWSTGVSAPGDVAGGVDTNDNYYVVSGLTPGQKVSLRVAAKDGEGVLSYGAIATGTAGVIGQAPQTGDLIASALDTTFAQVYDTFDKNIIFTIDKDNNSFVWYYVNLELGYVNIDNGDRLQNNSFANFYAMPGTNLVAQEVSDFHPYANLSQIPSGARYQNGQLVRSGDTYYHDNGAVLRSATGTWFYPSGNTMKDATTTFWPANITMRSDMTARYANNAVLKSGTTISYSGGSSFFTPTTAIYSNGVTLRNSAGNLQYETNVPLYSGNTFFYASGSTMINSSGDPFFTNGTPADFPFAFSDPVILSTAFVGIDVDHIAHYAIPIVSNTSVHVLGGTVDYSVVPPPMPVELLVDSTTPTSVTFELTSGGGTTQDLVYVYSLGATPPYTPDGGTVVSGSTFTIDGLAPGQQVAVRLFARNSEGEFSPGVTAVAHSRLEGDFNGDDSVDAFDLAQWEDDYGQNGDSDADGDGDSDGLDFLAWQRNFGAAIPLMAETPLPPPLTAATVAAPSTALNAQLVDLALADGTDETDGTYAQLLEDPVAPQTLRTRATARPDAPPRAADFGDIAASRPRDDDSAAVDASLDDALIFSAL